MVVPGCSIAVSIMSAIANHLQKDSAEDTMLITLAAMSIIFKSPPALPRTLQDWWTWGRDAAQSFMGALHPSATSSQQSVVTNVTPNSVSQTIASSTEVKPPQPVGPATT